MTISENIKNLRLKHGLSQKELGLIAGVTDKAVSTWEQGTKEPRMGAIQKIADHFGIKKSDIIEDRDIATKNAAKTLELTAQEESHIKKYRQLDADGKEEIDDLIDVKLAKIQRKAEETVFLFYTNFLFYQSQHRLL